MTIKIMKNVAAAFGTLLMLYGLLAVISPKTMAQVRGITAAQMSNLLGTTSYSYFDPVITGSASPPYEAGSPTNIGTISAPAPGYFFWNDATYKVKPGTPDARRTFGIDNSINGGRRFNFHGKAMTTRTMKVYDSANPATDNTAPLGTATLRYQQVAATEVLGLCPGGPSASNGMSFCIDTDDVRGATLKVLLGGTSYDVTVTQTP